MIPALEYLVIEVAAVGLNLAVDVLGVAADLFADLAEPAAVRLSKAAGLARWVAIATRVTP